MANANIATGLSPVNEFGAPWIGATMLVSFSLSNANNIFLGDPIVPTGAVDSYGVPVVTIATAGAAAPVLGAFVGVTDGPAKGASAATTLTQNLPLYRQASIANYGLVTIDPNQVYAIQEDGVGGAIASTTGGFANGNLIAGAGSTFTGMSGWMLDSSTVATGNPTYQVKVFGLIRGPDNSLGNYAKWLVRLNLPAIGPATAGF